MRFRIMLSIAVCAVAALTFSAGIHPFVNSADAETSLGGTQYQPSPELDSLNLEIALYESILAGDFDGSSAAAQSANCTGTECNLPSNGGVGCGCVGTGGCTPGGSGSRAWVECDDGNGTKVRCTRNSNGQGCNCVRT